MSFLYPRTYSLHVNTFSAGMNKSSLSAVALWWTLSGVFLSLHDGIDSSHACGLNLLFESKTLNFMEFIEVSLQNKFDKFQIR